LKDLFQGDVTLGNNLNAGYEIKKNTTLRADAPRDQGDSVTLDVTIQSIYRMQGAIQHATLMDTVSRVAIYSQLAEVQRAYRRGDSVELHRYAPTFPAFCEMMGLNYQSVKEHLNTYHLLGQEFFEQAERLGIPVREIRILKKLPPKQREKLINAVTSEGPVRVTPEVYTVDDFETVRYWLTWSSPRGIYDTRAEGDGGQRVHQSSDIYVAVVAPDHSSVIADLEVPRLEP